MSNAYLLGIDLGTTNVKALLCHADGREAACAQASYPCVIPREGWVEQRAREWWDATVRAIREVLGAADGPFAILGVCVSSQAPTMLPLDGGGEPLFHGLIWMDKRSAPQCAQLMRRAGEEAYLKLNHAPADPYYLLPKIMWFKENEPERFAEAAHIISTNGYINYRLTGELAWDDMQAELLTHCYDARRGTWSREAGEWAGVALERLLPPVRRAWDVIGGVTAEAARETGLPEGTPVLCGSADGLVAPLEAGLTRQGNMSLSLGTSTMLLYAYDRPKPEDCPLMHSWRKFDLPPVLSASVNTAGAALEWYARLYGESFGALAGESAVQALSSLAEGAPAGSGGLVFLPYLSGERAPLWDADLRGAFIGMSMSTERAHMARAVLEGTALAARHATCEARRAGASVLRCSAGGGGARSRLWLKIHASMLGVELNVSHRSGGAPLSDIIIAAVAGRVYNGFEQAIEAFVRTDEIVRPDPQWTERYAALYERYSHMRQMLEEDFHALVRDL